MPFASSGCYLYFWPIGYRWKGAMTPFLSPINLLQHLTELKETAYWLHYQFIIKGCNSGTTRWERCIWGKGAKLPCPLWAHILPKQPCVHQSRASLNLIHLSFLRRFHSSGPNPIIGRWCLNSISSSSCLRSGTESSNFLIKWLAASILRWPGDFPKGASLTQQKAPLSHLSVRKFQEF